MCVEAEEGEMVLPVGGTSSRVLSISLCGIHVLREECVYEFISRDLERKESQR